MNQDLVVIGVVLIGVGVLFGWIFCFGWILPILGLILVIFGLLGTETPAHAPRQPSMPISPGVTNFCPYCGKQVSPGALSCPGCGRKLG